MNKKRFGLTSRLFGPIELNKIFIQSFDKSLKEGTYESKYELIKALSNKAKELEIELLDDNKDE